MPTHVPDDQFEVLREWLNLALPHMRGGRISVREQERRALPMHFVVKLDSVAIQMGHENILRRIVSAEYVVLARRRRYRDLRAKARRQTLHPLRCPRVLFVENSTS